MIKLTTLPAFLRGDRVDKKRSNVNVGEIAEIISAINPREFKAEIKLFGEDTDKLKELHDRIFEDRIAVGILLQKYIVLATNSDNETLIKIAKLFNKDMYCLPDLLKEGKHSAYMKFLNELISQYWTVILIFIDLINNLIRKKSSHFEDVMSEDLEDMFKGLEE